MAKTTNDNEPFGVSDVMNYPDLNSNYIFIAVPSTSYRDFEIDMMTMPFKKRKNYKGIIVTCKGIKTKVKWTGYCFMNYIPSVQHWAIVVSDQVLINKVRSIKEKLLLEPTLYNLCIANNKSHLINYVGEKIVSNKTGNSTGKARKVIATKHKITRNA